MHLEESPHKCQVCNRSFNQRSNLKTHLLTHTDHKPYECTTCGKVFRRNCDLRRHALTHTIGGDMPTELNEGGNDSASEKILIDDENEDANELDEEFDDIQVDSPVREPNPPSPVVIPGSKDTENSESVKEERPRGREDLDGEPPSKMPRLEAKKDDDATLGITHCHHNGGQTHYTMRPQQGLGFTSDGKLHVRRDLHYKVDAPSTSIHSPNPTASTSSGIIGASVPFRKRAYESIENDHPLIPGSHLGSLHSSPLNLSNHASANRNTESSSGELSN